MQITDFKTTYKQFGFALTDTSALQITTDNEVVHVVFLYKQVSHQNQSLMSKKCQNMKYNHSSWVILLYCSFHYYRLSVRMNVPRTPQSMRKGSQVLRKAAQLKDTQRIMCVRVQYQHWTLWVYLCMCGREGETPYLVETRKCEVYWGITWSNCFSPRGPQLLSSIVLVLLSFPPTRHREPQQRSDLQRWHRGEHVLSVMNYMTPLLFKRPLCCGSVHAEAVHAVMPAFSIWVSRE